MNFLNINDDASHVTISALYSRDSPQQNCFHAQHQAIIWAIHHHLSYWQQFFPSSSFHLIPTARVWILKLFSSSFFSSSCFKEAHTLWKWNDEMWGWELLKRGGIGWVVKINTLYFTKKFATLKHFKRDIRFTLCSFFIFFSLLLLITYTMYVHDPSLKRKKENYMFFKNSRNKA